jgi:hypothetical protein
MLDTNLLIGAVMCKDAREECVKCNWKCCNKTLTTVATKPQQDEAWAWLERTLADSRADYLVLSGATPGGDRLSRLACASGGWSGQG